MQRWRYRAVDMSIDRYADMATDIEMEIYTYRQI